MMRRPPSPVHSPIRKLFRLPRRDQVHGESSIHSHALSNMYYQDWHHGVMPFYERRSPRFKVVVTPDGALDFANRLFSRERNRSESLESNLADFLGEVTQLLLLDEMAAYEICDIPESQGQMSLQLTLAADLEIYPDRVIQRVPKSASSEQTTIELERQRVFLIQPPDWIENGNGFALTLANLMMENKRQFAPARHLEKSTQGQVSYFDYDSFRETQETRVLSHTKASGWQARTLYESRMTEYYLVNRYLRFRYSTLLLRDYLLEKINRDLIPQLKSLGAPLEHLQFEGLLRPQDVLELQGQVERGEVGFKAALERLRLGEEL